MAKIKLICLLCNGTGKRSSSLIGGDLWCGCVKFHNPPCTTGYLSSKQKELIKKVRDGGVLYWDAAHPSSIGDFVVGCTDKSESYILGQLSGRKLEKWGIIRETNEKIESTYKHFDTVWELTELGKSIEL